MASFVSEQKPSSSSPMVCCKAPANSESSLEEISTVSDHHNGSFNGEKPMANNNNMFHFNNVETTLSQQNGVSVDFSNVKYTVDEISFTKRKILKKEILHGLSGEFKAGQLTAIMGPSGAGKSTLLNVMAGYVTKGVSGDISFNGEKRTQRDFDRFQALSCYIHQDDALRPWLTAGEAMTVATNLKLGYTVTTAQKTKLIKRLLSLLGLSECYNTMSSRLSGGQRKRLAVALEMISNPPILYLDEPTTGLDSSSCTQCVSLLKRLAQEGHTIVCTIHQPSALIFEMFDKLYAVAEGRCIYQGPVKGLVPFLSELSFYCPPYHNPADFLMEVAIGEHDADITKIAEAATKIVEHRKARELNDRMMLGFEELELGVMHDETSPLNTSAALGADLSDISKPASIMRQFMLLFRRLVLSSRRNYSLFLMRLIAHVSIALLFGYLYTGVGASANSVYANYVYLYGSMLLIVYTGKMSVTISFPLEMEMLAREHFNRWYKLGPYYLSVILLEIPFQIICVTSYVGISYYLTGNSLELFRIQYFLAITILATLCAQSWGYFIGATTPVSIAVFLGPILAVLWSVFGFCLRYLDIPVYLRWMFHISYFRAAFQGLLETVYGLDRETLPCPEELLYCHYKFPEKFLSEMDVTDISLASNIGLIAGITLLMHGLTIVSLWIKLNKR